MDQTKKLERKISELVKDIDQHGYIMTLSTDWITETVTVTINLQERFAGVEDWSHGQQ